MKVVSPKSSRGCSRVPTPAHLEQQLRVLPRHCADAHQRRRPPQALPVLLQRRRKLPPELREALGHPRDVRLVQREHVRPGGVVRVVQAQLLADGQVVPDGSLTRGVDDNDHAARAAEVAEEGAALEK